MMSAKIPEFYMVKRERRYAMPNWADLSKPFDKSHYLKNSVIKSSQLKCCFLHLKHGYF